MFSGEFKNDFLVVVAVEKSLGQPKASGVWWHKKEETTWRGYDRSQSVPVMTEVRLDARRGDVVVGECDGVLDELVAMMVILPSNGQPMMMQQPTEGEVSAESESEEGESPEVSLGAGDNDEGRVEQ